MSYFIERYKYSSLQYSIQTLIIIKKGDINCTFKRGLSLIFTTVPLFYFDQHSIFGKLWFAITVVLILWYYRICQMLFFFLKDYNIRLLMDAIVNHDEMHLINKQRYKNYRNNYWKNIFRKKSDVNYKDLNMDSICDSIEILTNNRTSENSRKIRYGCRMEENTVQIKILQYLSDFEVMEMKNGYFRLEEVLHFLVDSVFIVLLYNIFVVILLVLFLFVCINVEEDVDRGHWESVSSFEFNYAVFLCVFVGAWVYVYVCYIACTKVITNVVQNL